MISMKKSQRKDRERQMWVDKQLAMDLEKIKAQRFLIGKPVRSIGQLTEEMRKSPNWDKVMSDLLRSHPKPKIKIDKKRLI